MDSKLIDAYVVIDKLFSMGIEDEEEIINILKTNYHYGTDGAILALTSFVEDKAEIQRFIKRNNLRGESTPISMGMQ